MHIDIKHDLKLDASALVGARIAVLGISGSGKSNTGAVLMEEILPHMAGTIIDIDGDHYGLKAMFPALQIAGLGSRADLPLADPFGLANYSFRESVPLLLDFSEMRGEVTMEFTEEYLERLWALTAPEAARKPYFVMVEEAHKFVPQGRETAVKDVLRDLASGGRKRGITTIFLSQRSQKVDKDVLTSASHYFLHRVIHQNDLRTYQELIPRTKTKVQELVRGLAIGDAIYVDGERVQVIGIRPRKTHHGGTTPTLAGSAADPDGHTDGHTDEQGGVAMQPDVNGRWEAAAVAGHARLLVDELRDLCDRIEIAGSLRRKQSFVKDVEIVALPKHRATLLARLDTWVATGKIHKATYGDTGTRWGEKYRGFIYAGVRFEIFIADADNWGYILWLRTGPGDANQYVMQQLIYQKAPIRPAEGYFRECDERGEPTGAAIRVAGEAEMFRLLAMDTLAPEDRTLAAYEAALKAPHWWTQEWETVAVEAAPTQTGMFE